MAMAAANVHDAIFSRPEVNEICVCVTRPAADTAPAPAGVAPRPSVVGIKWASGGGVAALPTTVGPTDPPRLPIMLMNPIADAAAADPRKVVGMGQNAGRWAYMQVPTQTIMTTAGQTGTPASAAASQSDRLHRASGNAACHGRSPV